MFRQDLFYRLNALEHFGSCQRSQRNRAYGRRLVRSRSGHRFCFCPWPVARAAHGLVGEVQRLADSTWRWPPLLPLPELQKHESEPSVSVERTGRNYWVAAQPRH